MTDRWRVGFLPADAPRWWQRPLAPGFAHVWAARAVGAEEWLWCEWTPRRALAGLVRAELVARATAGSTLALDYQAQGEGEARPALPLLGMHHCVMHTAHLLGLRVSPLCTPLGLARALERRGAVTLSVGRAA